MNLNRDYIQVKSIRNCGGCDNRVLWGTKGGGNNPGVYYRDAYDFVRDQGASQEETYWGESSVGAKRGY